MNKHQLAIAILLVSVMVATTNPIKINEENYEIKAIPKTVSIAEREVTKDTFVLKESIEEQHNTLSRGARISQYEYAEFTLTYYTNLPSENGGYTKTCEGKPLEYLMVASNYYPLGTKIYLEGVGTVVVSDRGGKHFNNSNRLDVFIPRNSGESSRQYLKRVNNMGKKTVRGYILK